MKLKNQLRSYYRHWVVQMNWQGQLLRKIRRFYLGSFRPEYIEQAIQTTRQGECHRCGLCCELLYRCPFLGRDSQNLPYCRIYGELRPTNCKNYPFDSIDAEISTCGYSFKEQTPPPPARVSN